MGVTYLSLLTCSRLFMLYITESTQHLREMQVTDTNLANLGCRECMARLLWQKGVGAGQLEPPREEELPGDIRASPEAGSCSIPQSFGHSSPVPGRESPTGPARSPDHPLARQGPDIGIDSSPELQVAGERVIGGDSGYCSWRKGQVETIDVCYVGTVISPFHKCGN